MTELWAADDWRMEDYNSYTHPHSAGPGKCKERAHVMVDVMDSLWTFPKLKKKRERTSHYDFFYSYFKTAYVDRSQRRSGDVELVRRQEGHTMASVSSTTFGVWITLKSKHELRYYLWCWIFVFNAKCSHSVHLPDCFYYRIYKAVTWSS